MRGPSFEELVERGKRFREHFDLDPVRIAVYAWHDCVGHCLFEEFTPPTLEGEMLAGRHQWLVRTGDIDLVLRQAPEKFDLHLKRIGELEDPDSLARRDALLAGLEEYLRGLVLFENLLDYDEPFLKHLKGTYTARF